MNLFNKLIFEPEDHQILEIIDNYYNPSENNEFSNNFDGELHPRGIIQLATPQYMRLIIVMLELLNSTDNNSSNANTSTQKTHKVVKGDSLWAIAQKYYGKGSLYPKIKEANKSKYPSLAKSNVIYTNMELIIP